MSRNSITLLSCLFVIALAIIGCGGGGGGGGSNPVGPAVINGETASLSGTVLFDNTPLANASVFLYKSEKAHTIGMAQLPSLKSSLAAQQMISDGAYTTTTDVTGGYNFIDIPVGQYTLIAMRDENHQFVQTGVLLGQVTTLNPQLTPTGKITGKVTQTIGGVTQNISGAFVYITGTCYIALTNASGTFTIGNVPSNLLNGATYEVQVIHALGDASAKTGVIVNPGETTNIGIFALAAKTTAYQILSGSLVARNGVTSTQLGGTFLMLTRQEDNSMLGTNTDASGNYLFSVSMPGNYVVMAVNTDYLFDPGSVRVEVSSLGNSSTTLTGIYVDAARAQNTGSIVGTVTLAGSPVAGAVVHASGTSLLGVSNSTGKFVIDKVPANTSATPYTIEVSSSMGTATAKTGVVVSVGQATDVGAFAITLPTTGYKTITGQLVAVAPVTTAALANRLVQLTGPDGKVSAVYTGSTGAFSFMTTQTGAHTVTIMDTEFSYAPRTQGVTVAALDNAALALSQQASVSLQDNTGSITGQVTAAGSPLAGAVVCVAGTPLLGVSDSAGNFTIGKVPANTSVTPYTLEVSSNLGTAPAKTGVVVSAGQATNVGAFAIVAPTTGYKTITGQLTAVAPVTTAALANRLVQLTGPDGKVSAVYTGSTGAFSFMTTQIGAHSVTIMDTEFSYTPRTQGVTVAALDSAAQALSQQISVSLLDNTGSITGQVTTDGSPLAGAVVCVAGTPLLGVSDSAGNFTIGKVPANTSVTPYTLEVSSNLGTAPAKTGVVVSAGQAINVGAFAIVVPTTGYKTITGQLVAVAPVTTGQLENCLVQITSPDGKVNAAYSDSTGAFSFMATQTGAHIVTVIDSDLAYSPRTQNVTVAALDNGTQALTSINVTNPDNLSRVEGIVTWATPPGDWVITDGEVILESGTYMDRRVVSNTIPAVFHFDNVPGGGYTLRTNPLRNGYDGSIAITINEGVDLTGQSLTTTFVSPFISTTSATEDTLSITGTNFGTISGNLQAFVNDKPLTNVSVTDTICSFNIASLPPGEHSVQLVKAISGGQLASNKRAFTRLIAPPTLVSTSSTYNSITFSWLNDAYVTNVAIDIWGAGGTFLESVNMTGSSYTRTGLDPETMHEIMIRSVYANSIYSSPINFQLTTQAASGGSTVAIQSFELTGGTPIGGMEQVFGFEVVNGVAFVASTDGSTMNIQSFDLSTNALLNSASLPVSGGFGSRSMAANSSGVYLIHDNSSIPSVSRFDLGLGAPVVTKNLGSDFSFSAPVMAKVRNFNERIFMAALDASKVELRELDASLNVVASGYTNTLAISSADIACDPVTNTIYVASVENSVSAVVRAFDNMDITNPTPQEIGTFTLSGDALIDGFYAHNNKIYISEQHYSYTWYPVGSVMDAGGGYVTAMTCFPGNFGHDKQNRIWVSSLGLDGKYLLQLDNNQDVQQSLRIYNTGCMILEAPVAKLDTSTGMMYLLHFNSANALAVYAYDSNS
ncbi:MAG: hypothetical protein A2W80_04880 [Candidatus Riflebacteria bacterium GWC2_50_8]|nr:MAG: hypothetical protein A2W80_04880 [Candidatus Riflebacteria bacterium GWC2_50_8]